MFRLSWKTLSLLLLDLLLLAGSVNHISYLRDRARAPFLLDADGIASVVVRILDPAAGAGVSLGDTVTAVAGIPIRSPHDLEFLTDAGSIGDTLPVEITRHGATVEIRPGLIPYFGLRYLIVCLLVGLITLGVAVFVILARPKDRAAEALHLALASLGFAVMLMWGRLPPGDFWGPVSRALYFVTYLGTGVTFYRFTTLFPRPMSRRPALLYLVPLMVMAGAMTVHLVSVVSGSVEWVGTARHLLDLYRVTLILFVVLGIRNIIISYGAAVSPDQQKQLQWVIWGLTVGPAPFFLLEVIPELIIPLSPVPEEYTLLFLLAIPVSFATALVRYHLFDIQVVIRRTTVYGTVIALLVAAYLLLIGTIASLIGSGGVATSTVATVIVALGFEPLRRRVQTFVDRKFFRVRYSYREAERECVEEMKRLGDAVSLARALVERVQELMPASGVSFCLADPSTGKLRVTAEAPPGWMAPEGMHLSRFAAEFPRLPAAVARWVEPGVPFQPIREDARDSSESEELHHGHREGGGVLLALPLASSDGRPIGLLLLGEKRSGVRYSREDIDLLMNLTTHAGLEIDRIRLQQTVVRQEAEAIRLRELNELKSGFVDSVSHEFKTPVTGILLFAERLGDRLGPRHRSAREDLRIIAGEAKRLDRMVTNILDSRRIERGEKQLRMERVDLVELIREACAAMRYSLEMNGFAVTLRGTGRPIPIMADPDGVIEAVTNIIENGMKYSGSKKSIAITCRKMRAWGACSVRDWGVGISPEALPRIFEKHFRDPANGSVAEGFGIGLSVVDAIMRGHGGRVEVVSTPGKGSTFTLLFPLRRTCIPH